MSPQLGWAALLVGMVAVVDRKAFGQFMLSRPLVAAPALGWALGDAEAGLWVGVPLELFFLSSASYGASTPENETVAALVAAALQAQLRPHLGLFAATSLSLGLSLPFAALGRRLEAAVEHAYERIADRAEKRLADHHPESASRQARKGLVVPALVGAATVLLGTLLGRGVAVFSPLWRAHEQAVVLVGLALGGVATGIGARSIRVPRGKWLSWAGAIVAAAFLWRGLR